MLAACHIILAFYMLAKLTQSGSSEGCLTSEHAAAPCPPAATHLLMRAVGNV